MAEESFPFQELVDGDRTVSAALFAKHLGMIRTAGAIKNVDNELAVTESSPQAMSVDLDTGAAFVGLSELRSYRITLARTLPIAAADPTNPRHDLVVLDMDTATTPSDTRRVTALIVQGTPAASPVDPTLLQTEARYQLVIARVVVGASAGSITNSDVTDLRTFSEPANIPAAGTTSAYTIKAADETVNNSATLQNDDDFAPSLDANSEYFIELWLHVDTNTTARFKFAWDIPAGATIIAAGVSVTRANNNDTGTERQTVDATGAPIAFASGQPGTAYLFATITTAGTAGTAQFQWAQNTANASDTKVLADSVQRVTKVS
jgi:hypothetical protein